MVWGTHQGETVGPGAVAGRGQPRHAQGLGGLATSGASAVALGALVAGLLAWLELGASTATDHLLLVLHVIGVALFLAAGVLRLSRWRIAGDERSLLMGAALVVLGGVAMPLTSLAGVIAPSDAGSLLSPLTAVTTSSVALILIAAAVMHHARSPRWMRDRRVVYVAVGTAVSCFLLLATVHATNPEALVFDAAHPRLVRSTALTMAWLGAGLAAAMHSLDKPWAGRVAPLLGCMGVAEVLRTVGVFHPGGWEVSAGLLVVVIAALSSRNALTDLADATMTDRGLNAERASAAHEELQHDARNALAGVRAALVTLDQFGDRLDPSTAARLRTTVLDEVGHLEHMLLRDETTPAEDFALAPLLGSVTQARQALGDRIVLEGPDIQVHGRPGDLVTVLQNLLVNAAQHGAGQITVSTVLTEDRVEIRVSDNGPGVPRHLVGSLFERGVRSPESTGKGLGLHIARNLMREQGGDLLLRRQQDRCAFVCTLPTAAPGPCRVAEPVRGQSVALRPRAGALVLSGAGG